MDSECANPLLLQWVGEWYENAKKHSTKGVTTYKKAYESLKACPIPFEHPSEAQQLQGIGDKLCARLTDKMTKHCQENGLVVPLMPHKKRKKARAAPGGDDDDDNGDGSEDAPAPKRVRKKPYVPKLGSGAYAIMLALAEVYESHPLGIIKTEVIERAQPHCEASFTVTDPGQGKFYTAFNSMKTLQDKDLVIEKKGSARRYGLTDEGWEVVQKMKAATLEPGQQTLAKSSKSNAAGARTSISRANDDNDDDDDSMFVGLAPAPRGPPNPYLRPDDGFQEIASLGGGVPRPQMQRNPFLRDDDGFQPTAPAAASNSRSGGASQFLRDDDNFQEIGSSPARPRPSQAARRQEKAATPTKPPPSPFADVVPMGKPSDSESIPSFSPIVLRPGTFTVQLVLDNREIRTKKDRDYMENGLLNIGVKPIKRSLELGDALWVAKLNDPNYLSQFGAEGDEIMLDHIVERKRLDDLIGSIKDGRYQEQKFRLTKSGVKNVCYIIEEFALNDEHRSHYEPAVESAIASMQVVNNYFVKKTIRMDDTINHLARMTKLLKNLYEGKSLYGGKTLHVIPTKVITAENYPRLRAHLAEKESNTDYYITYQAFASLGSKSETLTLRDVFLKMLMCTKGVTGEKALEIQKRWKTPYEFVKAFEELGDGKEGEKKKKDFVFNHTASEFNNKRKIGKAVSCKVAAVWADVDYS